MSTLGEALAAIRSIILIEERVRGLGAKIEKLTELVVDVDRRLVRVETTLDIVMRHSPQAEGPLAISGRTQSRRASED